MQPVLEEGLSQGFLDFSFTGMRLLPSIEPNDADYFIDVLDYPLNHDGCIAVARLFKQLGERRLATFC